MSTDRFDSPEEAARYGFPAECRIVAMRKQGDAAYVLLDTGPAGRPYLYGVNCQRRDGSWSPGASGNGPGWSQVGADKELGTLTVWGDARSEEHTSELQSLAYLVCRLLLEKKKKIE